MSAKTFILGIDAAVDGSCYMPSETAFGLVGLNTGNLAFHYAMLKILGGDQKALPWHTPPAILNGAGTIGIMPLANHLGPHTDFESLVEGFRALNISLVAVGLGAQGDPAYSGLPEVPEGTQLWVKQIASRSPDGAPNIGVRGPFTLKVLEHYGLAERAIVTGCPTLFLNPSPDLGQQIAARARRPFGRIGVAGGHQGWVGLTKIESSLTAMMETTGGSYFVQSPLQMIQLARGEADLLSIEDLTSCRDYVSPQLSLADFKGWSRRYFRVFFNVSEWMECLRGYDFIVGTRIHGVMLGLQAGIPSLCVVHDSRTRELCETMQVPFVLARDIINGLQQNELRERFAFDGEAFDNNRKQLAKRLDAFLISNSIPRSKWLNDIIS